MLSFLNENLNYNRDYLKWALKFFQQEFLAGGLLVTEINSAAILAELQLSSTHYLLNGVRTAVNENTVTPSSTTALPVKLMGTTGPINITAGDLNVQLTDLGANFDRTRIGDGVEQLEINTDGSVNVRSKLFDEVPGNSKEFTYYSGVVVGNPSGNKNVNTIVYKTGVTTMWTKTFTYDSADDVLTITTS